MKRRPLILLILTIALCLALWVAREWWLPFFQNWLPQLADDLGNQIQSIEAFVALLVLLGGGLWGLWSWFTHSEQGNRRDNELVPLRATTWQTLRERSPQGARVPWIDRGATDANGWRAQPRLALIGLSGEGKSREAAELIRRAVELDLVAATNVFEPNRDFLHAGAALTTAVLDKVVEPTQRACLFIDDLHSYSVTTLEQLATLLTLFTPPQLDHRYVIATVRSDLVSAEQQTWLTQQGFQLVRLPKINPKQAEQWLTSAGQVYSLTFSRKVRQTFIQKNQPGTPGHLLRGLLTIKSSLADNNKGQASIKPAQVAAVMSDLTAQERQALYRRQPLAAYLLTALSHFHAAEVRTAQPLILAYAAMHYRRDHRLFHRWQAWQRGQTLRRTLTYLLNFDVSVKNGLIVAPDALLEGANVDDARRRVGDFLVAYRRPFHNRLLRRFHRHAEAQRWALFDLALQHQEGQEHEHSEQLYTVAISVSPHHWCYNNRGFARKEQGDLSAAIADYDQAITLNPHDTKAYYNRGFARQDQGDWPAAIADFDQAITLNPQDATAYYNRGIARKEQGDLSAAIADFDQAIALNPQYAKAYNNRGLARYDQGELPAAIADYDQAITLNPQYADAYNNRGLVRQAQSDWPAAITDYDQAIALLPDDNDKAITYYNRGNARNAQGELPAAIADYDQAIALNPQYADAYNNRGNARQAQGDLAAAIADYDQAITLNPQYAMAYNNRGFARQAQSDLTAAIADYDQTITLNPQFAMAYNNRGLAHKAQGDLPAAIADYNQAIALNPHDAMAFGNRGLARYDQRDWPAAIADFDQAIALFPNGNDKATAYYNRGLAHKDQGELPAAIADFDQAIALNPQDAAAYTNRGSARKAKGNWPAAIADYDQAIALFPDGKDKATAYNNRGAARADQDDWPAAIADYDQAIALDPQYAAAYNNRGIARKAQGDWPAAITDYDQSIALFPNDKDKATAYNNRAIARRQQGDLEGETEDYQQLIQLTPDDPQVYSNLAMALRLLHRWSEAQTACRRAVQLDPTQATAWVSLADAAWHTGAEEEWRQAIEQARHCANTLSSYDAACLESVAGNIDHALEWLSQAAQADDFDPAWAYQDPDLAWVRADSRFVEIMGKIIDKKDIGTDKLEQAEGERQVTVAETKIASKT